MFTEAGGARKHLGPEDPGGVAGGMGWMDRNLERAEAVAPSLALTSETSDSKARVTIDGKS